MNTHMKVALLDLKAQYASLRSELEPAVLRAMADTHYIMGPDVTEFEKEIQNYCGVAHAIACANGSDALRLALMATGVGAGDEVIVPTYTFFATAGAVSLTGATPVFCDIEPDYYNLDVHRLERHLTSKTKAIIPVHLYGQCADMDPIMELAGQKGLTVIEDGAQAIGAGYKQRPMGSMGHMATLSFFPSKNLGCAGDGGMLLTNDAVFAENLRNLRLHGAKPKYYHQKVGFNSRLDTLQASILRVKLKYLDSWTKARDRNACIYYELLADLEKKDRIKPPSVASSTTRHVYNQFVISVRARDELREFLKEKEIGTEIYYPLSLHEQECFAYLKADPTLYPNAGHAARSTVALPIYPELTKEQIGYVAQSLAEFYSD